MHNCNQLAKPHEISKLGFYLKPLREKMLMINLIAVVLETHNFCVRIHQIEHDLQKLSVGWETEQAGKKSLRQMSLKIP